MNASRCPHTRRTEARPTAASAAGRRRSGPRRWRGSPSAAHVMGTSHRQEPVKDLVARIRGGIAELFEAPDGYEVRARQRRHDRLLGRGRGLPRARARAAPDLRRVLEQVRQGDAPRRRSSPIRSWSRPTRATRPSRAPIPGADVLAWAHNETSTGVMVAPERPAGRRRRAGPDRRHLGRRRAAARREPRSTPTTSPRRRALPPTAGSGSRC